MVEKSESPLLLFEMYLNSFNPRDDGCFMTQWLPINVHMFKMTCKGVKIVIIHLGSLISICIHLRLRLYGLAKTTGVETPLPQAAATPLTHHHLTKQRRRLGATPPVSNSPIYKHSLLHTTRLWNLCQCLIYRTRREPSNCTSDSNKFLLKHTMMPQKI